MKAKLTPEENRLWEEIFADLVEDGHTDEEADAITWAQMQNIFPRLKEFDGCEPGNHVPSGHECPQCSESNVDHLLINEDDETVTCQTCGNRYKIGGNHE